MSLPHPNAPHRNIACFISSHGLGHAARAIAIMESIHRIAPWIHFHIFTKTPRWFFSSAFLKSFTYHELLTDIGLVQQTPFHEDIEKTVSALDSFLPFDAAQIEKLATRLCKSQCELVICDISPLGIAVAKRAKIPSVLVENFTWDWIYQNYERLNKRVRHHIDYLKRIFISADYHIQTEPICSPVKHDFMASPISRNPRKSAKQTRQSLGISTGQTMILISLGGIRTQMLFLEQLLGCPDIQFIVPGGADSKQYRNNLLLLPHESDFYHPDLVYASDAVIGKVGYSTLAEVFAANVPFGYIPRPDFPESQKLINYIEKEMRGYLISSSDFSSGNWINDIKEIIQVPEKKGVRGNGADAVARFICSLLH